jgi:hypothetical protein
MILYHLDKPSPLKTNLFYSDPNTFLQSDNSSTSSLSSASVETKRHNEESRKRPSSRGKPHGEGNVKPKRCRVDDEYETKSRKVLKDKSANDSIPRMCFNDGHQLETGKNVTTTRINNNDSKNVASDHFQDSSFNE